MRAARSTIQPTTLRLPLRASLKTPTTPVAATSQRLIRSFTTTPRLLSAASATSSSTPDDTSMSPEETSIADLLRSKLQGPVTHVLVQDISGGCGSMYAIEVTAEDFRGKTMLKQQRMVNAALGEVIKGWHGVQIRTTVPEA